MNVAPCLLLLLLHHPLMDAARATPAPTAKPTPPAEIATDLTPSQRTQQAKHRSQTEFGSNWGRPVFLRIIKENDRLELWIQDKTGAWSIAKNYTIAAWSGTLGPKQREGDGQSPEGFYEVTLTSLNPCSNYHLSFNIGYPNAHDRAQGRTGSHIMIHGSNLSIGCYAMTDTLIEEIYGMVEAALKHGQRAVPVQIYPFNMTPERMQQEAASEHISHWRYLQPGWQHTESHNEPYTPAPNP